MYTTEEYTDMIITYGMAGKDIHAAVRLYAERFPRRKHPEYKVFLECIRRGRETGFLLPRWQLNAGVPRRLRRHVIDEKILQALEENSSDSLHRVLRQNRLHQFRDQQVQHLIPEDKKQRIYYCEGFLAQCRRNDSFPDRILWTSEATFTPNGVFIKSNNILFRRDENLHAIRQDTFEYRWTINVWAGIKANRIIGPYILPARLNGERYAQFLKNELLGLLEDVPLREREELIFQHDVRSSRRIRNILNARYPQRWMGRGGPIIWPARSPDLNVLNYFVWGHVKDLIEYKRGGTEAEVREEILAAFRAITPEMAYRATRDITSRAKLCIQEQGRRFE